MEFGAVECVSEVVVWSVLDKGDVFMVFLAEGAEFFGDGDVVVFIASANVVCFSLFAVVEEVVECVAVVVDVHPVAAVLSCAVEGDVVAVEEVDDAEGDEFFWELVWSKVVGASGDDCAMLECERVGLCF